MKNTMRIFALLLLSVASLAAGAQTLDDIVAKHVDAIGGKANWDKVKSLRSEITMKAQGAEIQMTLSQLDKTAMRTDIALMGMKGYSIITTTEGWNFMPFQGQTKPEPMTADEVKTSQNRLHIREEFVTWKEMGKKLELLGKDDVDGTECHKLKMTDKDGQETTYWIDASNYMTVKQSEKIKANGKEIESATTFSNYKKLDEGVTYPMTISSNWGDMEIAKLEINPKLDETIFKAPAAAGK